MVALTRGRFSIGSAQVPIVFGVGEDQQQQVKSASRTMPAMNADIPAPGFSFDNCRRNAFLVSKGYPVPKATKTGTTIAGIVFKDGVILGADTRATSGSTIADKNCWKIHYLAPNIYCCGAGTAADTEKTSNLIASQLELLRLSTGRPVPVCTANQRLRQMLYRYQGHIGAAYVLGGVDSSGGSVYSIFPHGSSDRLPYTTMGSGSLAAMAVLERDWRPDLSLEEGKKLMRDAIAAGIFNDLGSGSNVDLCIITKEGKQVIRPYDEANKKGTRHLSYKFKKGTTAILSSTTVPLDVEEVVTRDQEAMDTSS